METVEFVDGYGKEFICDETGGKFDRNSGFILIPVYFQQSDGSYGPNPEDSSSYTFPPYCTEVLEGPVFEEPIQQEALPPVTKKVKSKSFTCDLCGGVFTKLDNLKRHVEDMHRTPVHVRYVCTGCGSHIKRKDNLIQHQKKGCSAVKNVQCPVCNKCFSSLGCMRRHIRVVHNKTEAVSCELCGYQTAYKHQLKSHKQLVHESREGMFVCCDCEIDCLTRYGLNQHRTAKRCGVLDMVCRECKVEFRSKRKMELHKRTEHGRYDVIKKDDDIGDIGIVSELLKLVDSNCEET